MLGHVRAALGTVKRHVVRVEIAFKSRFRLFRPLTVQVFRSHGSTGRLYVRGRVIESEDVSRPTGRDSWLANAWPTVKRLLSDEVPDARVRVHACGRSAEAVTDQEGYYAFEIACDDEPVSAGWHEVRVELLESPAHQDGVVGTGELVVPSEDAEFGVISDLDDTVIQTGARKKATQVRMLLSRNARTHVPFPGIAGFYDLLQQGSDGRGENPIFYVSKSAWSLYDLFDEFLEHHGVPKGPMFLFDPAIIEDRSSAVGSEEDHKLESIGEVLDAHPELGFVLIGDSGQRDPETFREVVRRWPGRVRAVYLRDVTLEERDREVRRILREIEEEGVPGKAAETTRELALHAEELGLIPAGAARRVEAGGGESLDQLER